MSKYESLEDACLTGGPSFVLSLRIDIVEIADDRDIDQGECDWHGGREECIVDVGRDRERVCQCRLFAGRWQRRWNGGWWELE